MNHETSLPVKSDFDPSNGNLEAQSAWRDFGGLLIDAAKVKFRENPLRYQEDFMFMGGRAFAYYFPVIDDYLRTAPEADIAREAFILSKCVGMQFDGDNLAHVRHLSERVIDLAQFVIHNLHRSDGNSDEQKRIADSWAELIRQIKVANDALPG